MALSLAMGSRLKSPDDAPSRFVQQFQQTSKLSWTDFPQLGQRHIILTLRLSQQNSWPPSCPTRRSEADHQQVRRIVLSPRGRATDTMPDTTVSMPSIIRCSISTLRSGTRLSAQASPQPGRRLRLTGGRGRGKTARSHHSAAFSLAAFMSTPFFSRNSMTLSLHAFCSSSTAHEFSATVHARSLPASFVLMR